MEQQNELQPPQPIMYVEEPTELRIGKMFTSLKNDKVLPAFRKALAEIENAVKDSNNPHFNKKYADLSACMAVIKPALTKYDLSVSQPPSTSDDLKIISIDTTVLHDSGQYIRWEFSMPMEFAPKPHEVGKTITYARRFALAGFGVVAEEDDDGNSGSGVGSDRQPNNSRPAPPKAAPPKPQPAAQAPKQQPAAKDNQPAQQAGSSAADISALDSVRKKVADVISSADSKANVSESIVMKFLANCEILQGGEEATLSFLDMYIADRQNAARFAQKWKGTEKTLASCLEEAKSVGLANLSWIQVK